MRDLVHPGPPDTPSPGWSRPVSLEDGPLRAGLAQSSGVVVKLAEPAEPAEHRFGGEIGIAPGRGDPTLRLIGAAAVTDSGAEARPDAFGVTDQGRVRERNDDQFLIADLERSLRIRASSVGEVGPRAPLTTCQGRLYMVADGMGGHGRGDLASSVAVDAVADYVFGAMPWFAELDDAHATVQTQELQSALFQSQARVFSVANRKGLSDLRMGTTLTLAYVAWPTMYVLHAGDSRCYLLRDGQLWRMTSDHTLAAAMANRSPVGADPGELSPYSHVLTNAVGAGSQELFAEVRRVEMVPGDRILLCTDGLTGHVEDEEVSAALAWASPSGEIATRLVALANDRGGQDNITVVVARF